MLGGADFMNYVTGKLRLGKETLATISGYWDDCITIEDKRTGEKQTLWNPTPEVRLQRLKRWTVAPEDQLDYESDKMWSKVSAAIRQENQELATSEKTILEEAQRNATKMRMAHNDTWIPRCFELDPVTGESWHYRHADFRPWDQRNDVIQYESNCVIATKTRHKTPMIREASIVSVERQTEAMRQLAAVAAAAAAAAVNGGGGESGSAATTASGDGAMMSRRRKQQQHQDGGGSLSSSAEGDHMMHCSSDESRVDEGDKGGSLHSSKSAPSR